jgi:hypothetical protein
MATASDGGGDGKGVGLGGGVGLGSGLGEGLAIVSGDGEGLEAAVPVDWLHAPNSNSGMAAVSNQGRMGRSLATGP